MNTLWQFAISAIPGFLAAVFAVLFYHWTRAHLAKKEAEFLASLLPAPGERPQTICYWDVKELISLRYPSVFRQVMLIYCREHPVAYYEHRPSKGEITIQHFDAWLRNVK